MDSCEGSGLSTIESSQDSHPLFLYFFIKQCCHKSYVTFCVSQICALPLLQINRQRLTSEIQRERESRREWKETRPDTRLPQSHAGGQGPYLRSLDYLGRGSEAKNRKDKKKVV